MTNCVDLGTGTGATARSLRKRYQASVVGVDTSPEMLRAARDLTNTGSLDFCNDVTYKRHNAEATGLAGGKADVVSVFFLLHEAPAAARRRPGSASRAARRLPLARAAAAREPATSAAGVWARAPAGRRPRVCAERGREC